MAFTISEALPSDVESMIRDCDFPAMQGNPLDELMFPQKTADDSGEIIQFRIDSLCPSLHDQRMKIFKACTAEGTIVGYAAWTVPIWAKGPENNEHIQEKTGGSERYPRTLDIGSWIMASRQLAAEKRRVIKDQDAIYRLNLIAVNPAYQGKGVGSTLMAWGCDQADDSQAEAFVMAAPAAVRLYRKLGFEEVGCVQIDDARFTSMIRKPKHRGFLMGPVD